MSDPIDHADPGSFFNPLKALGFLARPAVTVPLGPRPASANYRGFHLNDWTRCVGCGTCQKICDNAAISMVCLPQLTDDPARGVRNLRPAIDYGRCCWCGLCVDLCPTGSLSLSREYVHTCNDAGLGSYFVLPDARGIHGKSFGPGWAKTDQNDLLDPHRQPMAERAPAERADNFDEIVAGYGTAQAVAEASRCVQCGLCRDACPAHMDAPEYIRAIWEGRAEDAVRWIYRTNPFAHVCGRVCTHRCETACVVGRRGEPLAIRWLKRHAMDALPAAVVTRIATADRADRASGRRVAIVGAGPAGLTAAFDLARQGHRVTVFESRTRAGGMLRYGIPAYRLPDDALDRDIDVIRAMGVDVRCNVPIGHDLTLEELRQGYDAVLLAVGLQFGRSTRIPGADHPSVRRAVELLADVRGGRPVEVPARALVIGGGNVAMDVARTLARLQRQRFGRVEVAVVALEDRDHLLADADELREAAEEGVDIQPSRGPRACVIEDGRLVGLTTWRVAAVFDVNGRFAPRYDSTDERLHPADAVFEAIGQTADLALLGETLTEALEWQRGCLLVDGHGRTSEPWLWAAGDMVRPADVITAVADGHRAAAGIHAHLETLP